MDILHIMAINGYQSNAHMHNSLMDMYAKCRSLVLAQGVVLHGVVNAYFEIMFEHGDSRS
jgi:hypothetical protein